jgi:hypothetical protein
MAETRDELIKRVIQSHDRYRASGIALMATVITLSMGILIGLRPRGIAAALISLPIALALMQQLAHYLGQMYEARSHFSMLSLEMRTTHIHESGASAKDLYDAMPKTSQMQKEEVDNMSSTEKWLRYSDRLCIASVISFFLVGCWAIMHLQSR